MTSCSPCSALLAVPVHVGIRAALIALELHRGALGHNRL
uniref:Uncharacterized protein n=1 Tax=Anguilla anguilla TaxID=7936 RepID=A0A0E9S482_ANGAN